MPLDTSLYPLLRDLFFYWQLSCSESQPPLENHKLYYVTASCFGVLSIQPKIPEILVGKSNGTDHFDLVRPEYSGPALKVVLPDRSGHFDRSKNVPFHLSKLLSPVPLFCINNQTRGGLGRVCATGMYRSIGYVEFAKFQIGILVEWKAPLI